MGDDLGASRIYAQRQKALAKAIAAATLSQLHCFMLPNDKSKAAHLEMALPEYVEARMAVRDSLKTLGFDTSTAHADVVIKGWEKTAIDDFNHTGAFLSFNSSGVEQLAGAGVTNPVLDAVRGRTSAALDVTAKDQSSHAAAQVERRLGTDKLEIG